jgi:pyrroline-5-carboxylate reductase
MRFRWAEATPFQAKPAILAQTSSAVNTTSPDFRCGATPLHEVIVEVKFFGRSSLLIGHRDHNLDPIHITFDFTGRVMNIAVTFLPRQEPTPLPPIAFIGGGNMARAIIGGLLKQGASPDTIEVVEPVAEARTRIVQDFGIAAQPDAGSALGRCQVVIWAVKPQNFAEAARPVRGLAPDAVHLSVAAGIPSSSIVRWLGTEHVVRAMPNTPALVGRGMTGLFARDAVDSGGCKLIDQILAPTGDLMWVDEETALDAVTAMSGSGPAYVFYLIEAMTEAGVELGLTAEQAHKLAVGTFVGASALASNATEPPAVLRSRVTSKGGTTHAAITAMESADLKASFKAAIRAAHDRAVELGIEFGHD